MQNGKQIVASWTLVLLVCTATRKRSDETTRD
jgi:hypothetical protein